MVPARSDTVYNTHPRSINPNSIFCYLQHQDAFKAAMRGEGGSMKSSNDAYNEHMDEAQSWLSSRIQFRSLFRSKSPNPGQHGAVGKDRKE